MLFSGRSTDQLNKHYGFDTALMSEIESDSSVDLHRVRQTLIKELQIDEKWIKKSDLEIVRWACQCVGTRAAQLSGVAVAATIKQTETNGDTSVGIDGRYARRFWSDVILTIWGNIVYSSFIPISNNGFASPSGFLSARR